ERLVLSDVPVYAQDGLLIARSESGSATLSLLPAPESLVVDSEAGAASPDASRGLWRTWRLSIPNAGVRRLETGLQPEASDPPAVTSGGPLDRLSAPTDYSGAAVVHLDIPAALIEGADRALLRVDW